MSASSVRPIDCDKIGGGFWKNVMIVAVLGGMLASLQAAIVSSARISFAMGRDRVIPSWFGAVSEKYQTPWNATILLGLLNGVEEVWGLGLAVLGLVLMFVSSRVVKARFYSDPSVSHGDTVEAELAGAAGGAAAAVAHEGA